MPERPPVAGDERADRAVARRSRASRPCSSRPIVVCQAPAASATASSTRQRVEARMSASVSSAGAYGDAGAGADRDPAPRARLEVDVGHPASGLADQPKVGEQLQQRFVDRRPLADEDERLRVADLCRPRLGRLGALRVDDDVVPGERARSSRAARPRAGSPPSRRRASRPSYPARPQAGPRRVGRAAIPHGCYDSG